MAKKTNTKSKAPTKKPAAPAKTKSKPVAAPAKKQPAVTKKIMPKKTPVKPTGPIVKGGTSYAAVKQQKQAAEPPVPVLTEDELKKCKSGLTKKDLDFYLQLLLEKRAEILGDVDSIQSDQKSKEGGNLSNMPLHMADIGTENYDQEFNLSLVESERKLLREIVDAILRIKKGYYGVCMETGKPIGKPRLEIKPWAKYCIEVARDKEKRGEPLA